MIITENVVLVLMKTPSVKITVEKKLNFAGMALAATMAVLSLTGCKSPGANCSEGASTCGAGLSPYACVNIWGKKVGSCEASLWDAHAWCAKEGGGSNAATEVDCWDYAADETGGETGGETGDGDGDGDGPLDFRDYVTSVGAAYTVDYALVYQIKNDFGLLDNDSTVLVDSGLNDFFQLSGVGGDDLAAVLGLQTGDILLSVNGESLDGIEDAIAAYMEVENDSTLVLSYKRGGAVYTHTYYIS